MADLIPTMVSAVVELLLGVALFILIIRLGNLVEAFTKSLNSSEKE